MRLLKRVLCDFRCMNPIYPLCAMVAGLSFGVVTLLSSSCHPAYRFLLLPRGALPFWLFGLLGIIMFILLAAGIGGFFSLCNCKQLLARPFLCLICATVLLMLWYHILFHSLHYMTALLLLFVIMGLLCTALVWCFHVNTVSMITTFLSLVIALHLLWLNIGIIFLN